METYHFETFENVTVDHYEIILKTAFLDIRRQFPGVSLKVGGSSWSGNYIGMTMGSTHYAVRSEYYLVKDQASNVVAQIDGIFDRDHRYFEVRTHRAENAKPTP